MATPRVFISFQMEDERTRNLLVGQARNKNTEIEFFDYSVREPFNEKWKTNCKARIAKTKGTVVLIGPTTHKSEAVAWEITETLRQRHPIFGVQITPGKTHTIPKGLPSSKVIRWDIDAMVKKLNSWT